jgi:N-acetyltransferase
MNSIPVEYPPLPVILEGEHVIVQPMRPEHLASLCEVAKDGELWKLWYTLVPSPKTMEAWMQMAFKEQASQTCLPFVIYSKAHQKIVGATRFLRIEKAVHRLEIGSTWYAKSVQRTVINTECKHLLLTHAFENLKCIAVEFRTHRMNTASRAAIERLGAQLDGIFRNHYIMPNGTMRDTAVYSILDTEWPTVKSALEYKLGR